MPTANRMRIDYMPISELVHWPRNPKEHDLGAIGQSVARFGFVAPIIMDETTGRIVAGHGRIDMLWRLKNSGGTAPDRIENRDGEWFVPVVRGIAFRSEHEAEAYLVADNQLTMLGGWQDADLFDILRRQAEATTLEGTGFDGDDVDELRRQLEQAALDANAENTDDDEPISFTLYDKERVINEAFAHFRAHPFPYRKITVHQQMLEVNKLAAIADDPRALKSNLGILVADTYQPHRFHCHATDKRSPIDSFHDDAQLRRAIRLALENGTMLGEGFFSMLTLVAGTQACSNFRPGIAMHYYRRFGAKGGVILDPCTGYGGRLVGWIASQLGGHYIGVDPNTETHAGNSNLARTLVSPPNQVTLINAPFEDADLSGFERQVDGILTSPPYFAKELYADEPTQSWHRYRTIEEWDRGFLRPMLAKCYAVLKPDRVCCINIADVKLRNRVFPLEEMTRQAALAAGFILHQTEHVVFSAHYGKGQQDEEVKTEPMFIFRKPRRTPMPVE